MGGVGSGSAVGVGMLRSRRPSRLTGWYGWDGRYRTAEASPPISPAASSDHNNATAGTKAPATTCASTSTGGRRLDEQLEHQTQHGDSSPTGPAISPEPSYRTQAAGSGKPLRNHGLSTRHSSKPLWPGYPHPEPPNSPASPPDTESFPELQQNYGN